MSMILTLLDSDDNGVATHRLDDSDELLLIDALNELKKAKEEALRITNGYMPPGDPRRFTASTFGIDKIDSLIKIIEGE
jgi:hypothetical protein